MRVLWTQDVSCGGLFVHTTQPPPLRSRLQVTIETPDGSIDLPAEVVHVLSPEVAEQFGRNPGVGLQFIDLSPSQTREIERYVDGIASSLGHDSDDSAEAQLDETLQWVRDLLRGYEGNDLYAAIGLEPTATRDEIQDRCQTLADRFETPPETLTPAQDVRVSRAASLVRKIRALLTDEERRLMYDFRQGFILAEHRMQGQNVETIDRFRSLWHRLFPERVAEAEKHAGTALRYEQLRDFDRAVSAGSAALHFDPFNHQLKTAILEWRELLAQRVKAASE
jgi:hypothetical protein